MCRSLRSLIQLSIRYTYSLVNTSNENWGSQLPHSLPPVPVNPGCAGAGSLQGMDDADRKCQYCHQSALDARLTVSKAKINDAHERGICLSYELRRPHITVPLATSDAVREVLGMTDVTEAALSQAEADILARRVVDDLGYLLERADVGSELKHRFHEMSPEEAQSLIQAWTGMPCHNAQLVEYCPILSGCSHCNTALLLLGAGDTAKCASMYMVEYMTKDSYEPAASLSVLADARKNIDKYPSTAEDTGGKLRSTKHFLQRVFNAGTTELSLTQAATIVPGIHSSGHSHSYVHAYVWDAVRLRSVLRAGGSFLTNPGC